MALLPYRVLNRYQLDGTRILNITEPECKSRLYLYWKDSDSERRVACQVRTTVLAYFEEYRASQP